jgi:hypothetical protein
VGEVLEGVQDGGLICGGVGDDEVGGRDGLDDDEDGFRDGLIMVVVRLMHRDTVIQFLRLVVSIIDDKQSFIISIL